jgi:coniferyl-aldehyde dehydrogenase
VVERILGRVVAGGVTVNDTLLHFAASGLPFGGVGASGMGAYHGQAGFDRFSHLLPVLWQGPLAASDRLKPPMPPSTGWCDGWHGMRRQAVPFRCGPIGR